MQGAREYANLFGDQEQHGRLCICSGSHARGRTLHIWVLPPSDLLERLSPWAIPGAVEVYGVVSGQPGWTETYGWLHRGKWVQDFEALVAQRRADRERITAKFLEDQQKLAAEAQAQIAQTLAAYGDV